jgi:hypothetical protein
VLAFTRSHEISIGGDYISGLDTEACRTPSAEVPTEAAVEEKAAQRNRGAVSDWKRESMRRQLTVELASDHGGANYGAARLRIDGNLVEAPEVDQQAIIAKREANPTMSSSAHRDLHSICAGEPDRFETISVGSGLDDDTRMSLGYELIPDHRAPEAFVTGVSKLRDITLDSTVQLL